MNLSRVLVTRFNEMHLVKTIFFLFLHLLRVARIQLVFLLLFVRNMFENPKLKVKLTKIIIKNKSFQFAFELIKTKQQLILLMQEIHTLLYTQSFNKHTKTFFSFWKFGFRFYFSVRRQ